MTKNIIKLFRKKRFRTISLEKSTQFTRNIIVYEKYSEKMLGVVEFKDKNRLHLVEFNHFTKEQKEELDYILNNFDKTYSAL